MTDPQRIEQFEKMAEADPDNELGHFSLGKAYLDAERYDDAARSLARTVELNPGNSKAYVLLATAESKADRRDAALSVLRRGYRVARERGDMMPAKEMAAMLAAHGEEPPGLDRAAAATRTAPAEGRAEGFRCSRCGGASPRLAEPPMRGELGRLVFDRVCASCWQAWIAMGTKVINELRLDFADPQAQDMYDLHMKDFLNLG